MMAKQSRILSQLLRRKQSVSLPPSVPVHLPASGELNEQWFQDLFVDCADIHIYTLRLNTKDSEHRAILVSCLGMVDTKQINEYVIPRIKEATTQASTHPEAMIDLELTKIKEIEQIVTRVFSGNLIIYFTKSQALYAFDASNIPERSPEEANTELSIKGPRDGFVEDLNKNVALVRKRLRTNSLHYEQFIVGKRSETRVALLYIHDFVRPEIINEARRRIQNIDMDILFSSAQLEEILSDSAYSFFPLLTYTGRPDFVVDCLVHGRIAIIVDGAPIAVIAPVNLTLLMKSPEDIYFPAPIVSFEIMIRHFGLLIALFLPGFWIALVSFNLEQVPFPLLATVVTSRIGLPMPGTLEAFMMLAMFEIFREAGVRLPKAVGQTIAVVGGIIVGDAVIQAGLASTPMLIMAALTAVSTFTLVNQTLGSAVTIIRTIVMVFASFLGMYGFILATIGVVLYLAKLESFGVPYLTPLSPLKREGIIAALFKKPLKSEETQFLKDEQENRYGEQS